MDEINQSHDNVYRKSNLQLSNLNKDKSNVTKDPNETLGLLTQKKISKDRGIEGVDKFTPASIITLFGGLVLLMISGLSYAIGSVSPYIVSYYRMYMRFDVTYDTFMPIQSLTELSSSIIFPIANYLVM